MATINKTSELPIAKAIGFSLNSTNVLSINELSPSSRRFYLKIIAKAIILDSICAGTSTVVSGKCTVLFTRTSDTSGTIAFSNVTDDVAFSVVGEAIQQGLIGTTWQFKSYIEDFHPNSWDIRGTMVSGSYSLYVVSFDASRDYDDMHFSQSTMYEFYYGGWYWICYYGSWTEHTVSAPRITFTGGADLTNEDFISWLQSNATRIS